MTMRVLVTGASRGIGRAICLRLVEQAVATFCGLDTMHGLLPGRPATER